MPRYTRKQLEDMKRIDLQKVCKELGLRANLKSESLIQLVLDSTTPLSSAPPIAPVDSSNTTRSRSGTQGRSRTSKDPETENSHPNPVPQEVSKPSTGLRGKAKDTQKRLGVGKPAAAGGLGARSVTRSSTSSVPKVYKSNSIVIHDPIQEEDDTDEIQPAPASNRKNNSMVVRDIIPEEPENVDDNQEPSDGHAFLISRVSKLERELISVKNKSPAASDSNVQRQPLLSRMELLEQKVAQAVAWKREVEELRARVTDLESTKTDLELMKGQLLSLDAKLSFLDADRNAPPSAMQTRNDSAGRPHDPRSDDPHPGFAPSLLGKRSRDSPLVNGSIAATGSSTSSSILKPDKKRLRMDDGAGDGGNPAESLSKLSQVPVVQVDGSSTPPNHTLQDDFGALTNPFSTTALSMMQPTGMMFESPSPMKPREPTPTPIGLRGGGGVWGDPFFGRPFSPSLVADGSGTAPMNPASSSSNGSSSAGGYRTMYGTEMDHDTRFGDFGLDGQAGFWSKIQ